MNTTHNFSYPSSAAAVVFNVYLSALGLFGLTGNRPQSAPACSFLPCRQPIDTSKQLNRITQREQITTWEIDK